MALDTSKKNKYVGNRYSNTRSDLIEITEDKLRNILKDNIHKIQKSKDWMGALGLFLSLFMTMLTCEFQAKWGFSKDFWEGAFSFALILSIFYVIRVGINILRTKVDESTIVSEIKNLDK